MSATQAQTRTVLDGRAVGQRAARKPLAPPWSGSDPRREEEHRHLSRHWGLHLHECASKPVVLPPHWFTYHDSPGRAAAQAASRRRAGLPAPEGEPKCSEQFGAGGNSQDRIGPSAGAQHVSPRGFEVVRHPDAAATLTASSSWFSGRKNGAIEDVSVSWEQRLRTDRQTSATKATRSAAGVAAGLATPPTGPIRPSSLAMAAELAVARRPAATAGPRD